MRVLNSNSTDYTGNCGVNKSGASSKLVRGNGNDNINVFFNHNLVA